MNEEIKRISESILSHFEEEIQENVMQYSLAKADLRYGNDNEVYWMVRKIEAEYTIIDGPDGTIIKSGRRIHLPEKNGEMYIARDSKFGALLISRAVGKMNYVEPSGNKVNINIFNTSLFEPKIFEKFDLKNVLIRTPETTYNFPSLREELDKLLEIEKLLETKELEKDESEINKLAEEINRRKKELESFLKTRKRHVIDSSGLRDQPILDEVQENIKRSEFKSRNLIIDGGPGTGKTTSLIQRITFLTSPTIKESFELSNRDLNLLTDRNKNWLFFSPTELLRQYLKNFMAKESLSPSDENVLVWNDYKKVLFRRLSLFNPDTRNPFQFSTTAENIFDINPDSLKEIYEKFEIHYVNFQKNKILKIQELDFSSLAWKESGTKIINDLNEVNAHDNISKLIRMFGELEKNYSTVSKELSQKLNTDLSDSVSKVQFEIEQNNGLKNEVYDLIRNELEKGKDEDEIEDEFPEEESENIIQSRDLQIELNRVLRNLFRKESLLKIDKNIRLTKFERELLNKIKEKINFDVNPAIGENAYFRKYFSGILRGIEANILRFFPSVYKSFRKEVLREMKIFSENGLEIIDRNIKDGNKKVVSDEIDLILNLLFRLINKLYNEFNSVYENAGDIFLREYKDNVRCIIAIDEGTDFSLLELSCMTQLSHPRFRTVSISGDIMQRLTKYGIKFWEEYMKLYSNTSIHKIKLSYRQTDYLINIAKAIYEHNTGKQLEISPAYQASEHDPKPLVFKGGDFENKIDWITKQIIAINKAYENKLPSIAILVHDAETLKKYENALSSQDELVDNGIKVVSCPDGKMLGNATDIRVFEMKFIKGMEFQAVFFIDIDMHSSSQTDLLDRYLYVGVSRASFYLAITLNKKLPERLDYLESMFYEGTW